MAVIMASKTVKVGCMTGANLVIRDIPKVVAVTINHVFYLIKRKYGKYAVLFAYSISNLSKFPSGFTGKLAGVTRWRFAHCSRQNSFRLSFLR